MTKSDIDQTLLLKRRIDAAPARVFAAWTNPETMRKWLTPGPCVVRDVENDVKVGGAFKIVSRAPDGAIHTITGRYLQIETATRLKMTWLYSGPIAFLDGIETVLEIDLAEDVGGTTKLTLMQSRIPTPTACAAFEADWPSCLDKLENTLGNPLQ